MGCNQTRSRPLEPRNEDLTVTVDMNGMDEHARFEHSFPFYKMHIDDFEGKVKRFVNAKETVSLQQLRFAFKNNKGWESL